MLLLSRLGVESAKAAVAVRLKRTHAQLLGQGESLVVVDSGHVGVWGSAMRGNLAKEMQGIGVVN